MRIYVVMGVSGCGKSTVARALAGRMHAVFLDADDFHSSANKQKMAAGIPLTDEDRRGWLDDLNAELKRRAAEGAPVFLACSALRQVYRDRLSQGLLPVRFIYLKGSRACLQQRVQGRSHPFMSPALLDSQLATLEEPAEAVTVEIDQPLETLVAEVWAHLQKEGDFPLEE